MKQHSLVIIDDDESIRDSCTQVLGRAGEYRIASAVDGPAGIDLARRTRPDVALVDLKLPGMNGIEIIQELRKLDPDLVCIIITGFPTVGSAVEAMKHGAYDFLPKPFTPDELRLIVRRALDKRRLEAETAALRREREAMQRRFVSLVSHELRAPLISVAQYVDALLSGAAGPVAPKQQEIFRRISARMDALMELIDKWLSLNRIKSGKLASEMSAQPLAALLREAVETLQPMAAAKGVSVRSELPGPAETVTGDRDCLRELALNLLGNAIKYNREGGQVELRARRNGGGGWVLEFVDTGRGIPEADLPHIFEEFYRGANADEASSGSSGLGLALVKQVVDLHGGTVEVRSKVGEGSVFTVHLPERKA